MSLEAGREHPELLGDGEEPEGKVQLSRRAFNCAISASFHLARLHVTVVAHISLSKSS